MPQIKWSCFLIQVKKIYLTVNIEVDRFQVTTNSIEFLILKCCIAEKIKIGFFYGCIEGIVLCALKFRFQYCYDNLELELMIISIDQNCALREKYPYSEFFWSVFSRIRTEYRLIRNISPNSVWMRENTDQKTPNTEWNNSLQNQLVTAQWNYDTSSICYRVKDELIPKLICSIYQHCTRKKLVHYSFLKEPGK